MQNPKRLDMLRDPHRLVSAVERHKVGLEENVAEDHNVDAIGDGLDAGKAVCKPQVSMGSGCQ